MKPKLIDKCLSKISLSCRSRHVFMKPKQIEKFPSKNISSFRSRHVFVKPKNIKKCSSIKSLSSRSRLVIIKPKIIMKCSSKTCSSFRSGVVIVKPEKNEKYPSKTNLSCRSKDFILKPKLIDKFLSKMSLSCRSKHVFVTPKKMEVCSSERKSSCRSEDVFVELKQIKECPIKTRSRCTTPSIHSSKESSISRSKSEKSFSSAKSSKNQSQMKVLTPSKEKTCRPRKTFCVFKNSRKSVMKRKAEEPKIKPKIKKYSREDFSPPAEPPEPKRESSLKEKKSLLKNTKKKEESILKKTKKVKTPKQPKKRTCRPVFIDAGTSTCSEAVINQYNVQTEKSAFETFIDAETSTCSEAVISQYNMQTEKPLFGTFIDAGTSTCSEAVINQYNVQIEPSSFETQTKMEPMISGDTVKTMCSADMEHVNSLAGNIAENQSKSGSEEIKYKLISSQLRERTTPESLINSISKSTTGMKDCLEATMSVYAPSLSSMAPHRFDDSHEILSSIIDHASNMKEEKTTETSTYPSVTFSASTSAQTCLIDYELFKGVGFNNKVFKKDYLVEETYTNGAILQKTDSSSV